MRSARTLLRCIISGCLLFSLTGIVGCTTGASNAASSSAAGEDGYVIIEPVPEENPLNAFASSSASVILGATTEGTAADERTNTCYSPASLYLAMAMLGMGTEGAAQEQILDVLGTANAEELAAYCENSIKGMKAGYDSYTLALANSIWIQDGCTFNPDYQKTIQGEMDGEAFTVDFASDTAGEHMGEWVNEKTEGLISPRFTPEPNQVAALIDTIYLKDAWLDAFDEEATEPGVFRIGEATGAGEDIVVDLMHADGRDTSFYLGEDYTAAQLPFSGGGMMTFYLPLGSDDPSELLATPEATAQLLATEWDYGQVDWTVPAFSIDSSFGDLVEALKALGITEVFDPDNERALAPMLSTGPDDLFVSDVLQETHLSLDESGVEAAAYTKVDIETKSLRPEGAAIDFVLDRPFAYSITSPNGTILFMGIVENPVR